MIAVYDYKSLREVSVEDTVPGLILLTQWIANVLSALYRAATERHLYWVPDKVRRAWRVVGLDMMLRGCES